MEDTSNYGQLLSNPRGVRGRNPYSLKLWQNNFELRHGLITLCPEQTVLRSCQRDPPALSGLLSELALRQEEQDLLQSALSKQTSTTVFVVVDFEPDPDSPFNSRQGDNKVARHYCLKSWNVEENRSRKGAKVPSELSWKLSDIQGINPEFCTHKILMEEDYAPAVQHQRRVNPKIHDVIKKEVEKLLEAGLIYPISDSPWVSPVHCVPKKVEINCGNARGK
ncbi:hypothetical protein Tco_1156301 [Tanacetum coccineum]